MAIVRGELTIRIAEDNECVVQFGPELPYLPPLPKSWARYDERALRDRLGLIRNDMERRGEAGPDVEEAVTALASESKSFVCTISGEDAFLAMLGVW